MLHRQKVVVRPDPSFMRFDSSESDNEDHSQFPGGGSSRKNSRETPKSRPPAVSRRQPKRVQFGLEDEPDEDERPRQLIGAADRRHTLSHMDLSNVVEELEDEEGDDDRLRGRRRQRLVDSVSSLLDSGPTKLTRGGPKLTHPVVAFLMGTRRSFKRRKRGGLTVSNLRRHVGIGRSMTNLSLSSSSSSPTAPRSSPSSTCFPPPVSLFDSHRQVQGPRRMSAPLRLTVTSGVYLSASDLGDDHRFTSMVHVDYPHPPPPNDDTFYSLGPSVSFYPDKNPRNMEKIPVNLYQNPPFCLESLPPTMMRFKGRPRRQLPKVPDSSAATERANRLVSYGGGLTSVLVF